MLKRRLIRTITVKSEKGVFLGANTIKKLKKLNIMFQLRSRHDPLMLTSFKAKMQDLIYDKTRTLKQIVGVREPLNMGGRERQIAGGSTNSSRSDQKNRLVVPLEPENVSP